MGVIAVGVPAEVVFLHALGELWRFIFQFQGGLEPMAPGRDAVHAFLIERIRKHARARHAETGLGQPRQHAAMIDMGMRQQDESQFAGIEGQGAVIERAQRLRALEHAAIHQETQF